MGVGISEQAIAFLWSVVMGGVFGAVNDFFRVSRILVRHAAFWVFLEDLFFSLLLAIGTFWSLAQINDGQVRLFLLLGEICGFILYFNTFGRLVVAVACLLSRFLQWLKGLFLSLECRFSKKLKKIVNFSKKLFIFSFKWCRMLLYHVKRRSARDGKKQKS